MPHLHLDERPCTLEESIIMNAVCNHLDAWCVSTNDDPLPTEKDLYLIACQTNKRENLHVSTDMIMTIIDHATRG
jgi:hypothetical protein